MDEPRLVTVWLGDNLSLDDGLSKLFLAEHQLLSSLLPTEKVGSLPLRVPGALRVTLPSRVALTVQYDIGKDKVRATASVLFEKG